MNADSHSICSKGKYYYPTIEIGNNAVKRIGNSQEKQRETLMKKSVLSKCRHSSSSFWVQQQHQWDSIFSPTSKMRPSLPR